MTRRLAALLVVLVSTVRGSAAPLPLRFAVGPPSVATFHGAFQGFGAEWDPFYWNANNRRRGADAAGWALITERMTQMNLKLVRMMMQLQWLRAGPDARGSAWDTPQMKSVLAYLDTCRAQGIDVILTEWGWAARAGPYAGPADPRFARDVAEYVRELVVRRGYRNVKYLILGNEPDNELAKDYGLAAYVAMYENVDRALRAAGVRDRIRLTGPDMGGRWDFMKNAVDRLHLVIDAYDFHRYASFEEISNRGLDGPESALWDHLDLWRQEILARDPAAAMKPLLLTEMGANHGSINEHPRIDSFEYALHMADYGTTLLTTRVNAGIAWTLHDVFYFDGDQFMRWGMWRYRDAGWSVRPWGHAFALLIAHAPPGSVQAPVNGSPPRRPPLTPYRVAAVKRPDGGWSVFLVNRSAQPVFVRAVLPEAPPGRFRVHRFDRHTTARYPDVILVPPVETRPFPAGGLVLPAESLTVLVESR